MTTARMPAIRMASPRLYAFGVTGALHIVLIAGLLMALQFAGVVRHPPPMKVIDYIEPPATVQPLLAPTVTERVVLPVVNPTLPEYQIADSGNAITLPVVHRVPAAMPLRAPLTSSPLLAAPQMLGRMGPPPYPSISRRLEEQGSVVLGFIVGPDGHVLPDSIQVLSGSGFERLDDAARSALQRIRFAAGTRDGMAVSMRHSFKITYSLTQH